MSVRRGGPGPGHYDRRMRDAVKRGVFRAGSILRNSIIRSFDPPKSGDLYRVPGTKSKVYQASAPGEPPAVATGNLRRNIEVLMRGQEEATVGVHDVTRVEYAPYLEHGTRKMAPRPWLRPAFDRELKRMKAVIREELRKAFR